MATAEAGAKRGGRAELNPRGSRAAVDNCGCRIHYQRRLSGNVYSQVETLKTEERFEGNAVSNVDIVVREIFGDCAEPVEIPCSVTGITELNLADVVVGAVDLMALSVGMFQGFRANQSAGTGN